MKIRQSTDNIVRSTDDV